MCARCASRDTGRTARGKNLETSESPLPVSQVLVDTDVLIWHLRGYAQATRRLDACPR